MRLIVKTNRVEYDFDIHRRVTIIEGNSGEGKTLLYNIIKDKQMVRKLSIQSPLPLISYTSRTDINNIHNCILLIDEDYLPPTTFFDKLQDRNIFCLIFSREEFIKRINYSIYEVYLIKSINKYKTIYPKYDRRIFNNRFYKRFISEDSKSGYSMFADTTPIIEGKSVSGNSNIKPEHNYLYLIDLANFPYNFQVLYELAKLGYLDICDRESFEEQLLNMTLFKGIKERKPILNPLDFNSFEAYFTQLLSKIMRDESGTEYSKKSLSKCFIYPCDYYVKCEKCRLNKITNKKLDFLRQNGLEYLIEDSHNTISSINF